MTHRWREEALEPITDRRVPYPPVWGNGVKVSIPGQIRAGSSRSQPTITRIPADGSRLGTADTPGRRRPPPGDRGTRRPCRSGRMSLPQAQSVEFGRELRPAVLAGAITVSFRLWQRPQVKVGGRYGVRGGQIEVDSVELIPFAFIDEVDIHRAGETDRDSLRQRAAHSGPIHDDTLVYRVEFHVTETDSNP